MSTPEKEEIAYDGWITSLRFTGLTPSAMTVSMYNVYTLLVCLSVCLSNKRQNG